MSYDDVYRESLHDWLDEREQEREDPSLDEIVQDHAEAFDPPSKPLDDQDIQDIPF